MERETSKPEMSFKDEIRRRVADELGSGFDVAVNTIYKVNVSLDGLTIYDRSSKTNISPTIYLNEYYLDYLHHDLSMEEIAEKIIEVYNRTKKNEPVDISTFLNWDSIKDYVVAKVINREKNLTLLESVPHDVLVEDLAVVYVALLGIDEDGTSSSILIKNEHADMWGVGQKELSEVAFENNRRLLPATVTSMAEVMKEMLRADLSCNLQFESDETLDEMLNQMLEVDAKMYVVSNSRKINGSIWGFDKELLRTFCNEHDAEEIVIIPSSIHETLWILPVGTDYAEFNAMCQSVNSTEVREDEILNDRCFTYTLATDTITLI